MFQFPAFISCSLDFLAVFLYFKETWLFEEGSIPVGVDHTNPLGIDLLIVVFAGK